MASPSKKRAGKNQSNDIILVLAALAVVVLLVFLLFRLSNEKGKEPLTDSGTQTSFQQPSSTFESASDSEGISSTKDAALTMAKQLESNMPDWIDRQLLDVDGAARRGVSLETVRDIAIHYVGNPGTSAQANRDYFNQPETQVSSHFLVGLDGEIIQCIPLNEKSSATNYRNKDTISIEVCHPDADGKFNEKTYQSLVKLVSWLCKEFQLDKEHVIRHYDVTGKECPLYYVKHKDAWDQLKEDIFSQK